MLSNIDDFLNWFSNSRISIMDYAHSDREYAYIFIKSLINKLPNTVVLHNREMIDFNNSYYINDLSSKNILKEISKFKDSNIFLLEPISFIEFEKSKDDNVILKSKYSSEFIRKLGNCLINVNSNILLINYINKHSRVILGSFNSAGVMYGAGLLFQFYDKKLRIYKNRMGPNNIDFDIKYLIAPYLREQKLKRILK